MLKTRTLGNDKLRISALGLGVMMMPDNDESVHTIQGALDAGVTMFDTADLYGEYEKQRFGGNEKLLGRALQGRRSKAIVATKFGITHTQGPKGDPAYIKKSVDASLYNLGMDYIDLYYQHRPDPNTPIEETVGTLADLVQQGKIRYIGLSEAPVEIIRRAHAVHPITALQTEYSLWSRELEDEIMPVLHELNIGLVPYSPLGRGFLTGQIRSIDDLPEDDYRRHYPRFQGENFQKNLEVVGLIQEMAKQKGCTVSQLALAWLLGKGEHIVPIPGTRNLERVHENLGALQVSLTDDEMNQIDHISPQGIAAGGRFPGQV
ncbi:MULTISPECIES: aldo/keto reductase [Paenibacillus]|uniref:aldo/keto reductase n=1 Tax=Paenibacillus TaxID=44249 RepID=UPI0003E24EE3|nr:MULTISPECIES: aldo/keto reductase [Paenibacillus]ETT47538.1 aldo/keto reductase [Paenibacillus sp. FSL H7-689]MCP1421536.1 aryl-alcohol dehydrogenase-like predicted oxidoreductase [Paenibacillus xylanexedens]PJN62333.1 General stress protein 69 [Paenibacillus sp. GM1FR]